MILIVKKTIEVLLCTLKCSSERSDQRRKADDSDGEEFGYYFYNFIEYCMLIQEIKSFHKVRILLVEIFFSKKIEAEIY